MKKAKYIHTYLKGMSMGMADIVPGVSGGTIAFISGIYETLLSSLKSLNSKAWYLLQKRAFKALFEHINIRFILPLFLGIFSGILLFSKAITFAMENYPVYIWSLFFGLISVSVYFLAIKIEKWNVPTLVALVLSTLGSYVLTELKTTATVEPGFLFWFLSGFIAISAMILPGISGSFILLILGAYKTLFASVNHLRSGLFSLDFSDIKDDLIIISLFGSGAILGLMVFSRVLSWLLKRYKNMTLTLLTGFIIGSLNKVWPWKRVLEYRINSSGKQVPFLEENFLPSQASSAEVTLAIFCMVLGVLLIYFLKTLADKKEEKNASSKNF